MTFSVPLEAVFDCEYLVQLKTVEGCQMYYSQREPVSNQCNATGLESHIAGDLFPKHSLDFVIGLQVFS